MAFTVESGEYEDFCVHAVFESHAEAQMAADHYNRVALETGRRLDQYDMAKVGTIRYFRAGTWRPAPETAIVDGEVVDGPSAALLPRPAQAG